MPEGRAGVGRRDVMGRRAILPCSNEGVHEGFPAAIPKSGPEIKNHCSIWADSGENLASIPKSGPEIKNHCSNGAILEVFPAAIPKFTP